MTSTRTTLPRRFRLGGWPVAAVVAVPITALLLSAGPAEGLRAEVSPTDTATITSLAPTTTPSTTPAPTTSVTDPGQPSDTPSATPSAKSPSGASSSSAAPTTGESAVSTADPTATPDPVPAPTADPQQTPTTAASIPPGLNGGAATIALLGAPGKDPTYLPPGKAATDLLPFQPFRVTVQLVNGGPDPVTVVPRLEFASPAKDFALVPEDAVPGTPLHATQEWVPAATGTKPAPETANIPAGSLHLPIPDGLRAGDGHRSSGANPAHSVVLAPGTATEQEFTVALSIDAAYGTTYELRVTDAGTVVPGLSTAEATVGAAPETAVSPGQQDGSPVRPASEVNSPTSVPTYALVSEAPSVPLTSHALTGASTSPAAGTTVTANGPATIHDPGSSMASAQCGVCHQTHSAQSPSLVKAATSTEQCYTCHAGGTGGADVQAQYALGQPANDPATRSYWSHDTTDPGDHTLDSRNEFQGKLTRHSQCSDCHNPHGATTTKAVMTPDGWTAPGGFTKVSGVAVTNGAAGTAPSYTWLDGRIQPVTAEYQLCFKCHSGFTTLPADVPGKPSQDVSDLGVEFNPANPSYHPIEAAGRNQTQKLADSLAGPSSYKLWNFTTNDTVRCVSCHAGNTTGTSSDPAQNAPDATATVHASTNRGILIRPYENRVLSASGQGYDNAGFALCLTCHTETPFSNRYQPAASEGTNFGFHGLHTAGISDKGDGGLDIDTPGAGQGNARCAECHFSSHGTARLPSEQKVPGDRLVVFAPDVEASTSLGGVPTFTRTATGGTCTLTCHGKDHRAVAYTN